MWLLEANTLNTILQAEKSGFNPSAEQLTAFRGETSEEGGSRIMSIAGETADISIKGVLTNTPDFMAMIFGGGNTTYSDIIAAIASAEQNDSIKNIVLSVDSPGGQVSGLFNAVNAIASAKKPTEAIVINQAASAAYTLIAQADKISAFNEASGVGSVGIATRREIDENEVIITSTEAPNKAPDVTTEAGKAVVREQLDAVHEILASSIAKGRSTTIEKVNSDFGRGTMILAGEAIKRGMMDNIAGSIPQVSAPVAATTAAPSAPVAAESGGPAAPTDKTNTNATNGKNDREVIGMTKEELQAQHPATFAAVLATGVEQERDRVSAHLTMAEASGDMATAVAAIADGSGMTASLQATYMAAGMKKTELTARVEDNPGELNTPAGGADGPSDEDHVADEVCAALGYDGEVKA
jgi:ClpP class serine protease